MPSDPQFNLATVLKPYNGFEAIYQNVPVQISINLTPNGVALDERAGQPGYDPRLPAGLRVPVGSRIIAWLPVLFGDDGRGASFRYNYAFSWRLRNLIDFKNDRKPYHQPDTLFGVPNTFGPMYPLPVAVNACTYNQTEPASVADPVIQHNVTERIATQGLTTLIGFLNPDSSLSGPQQGIKPPVGAPPVPPIEMFPTFQIYDTHAYGDELILSVTRADNSQANPAWDFTPVTGVDRDFANFFGSGLTPGGYPKLGVYVFPGIAP